MEYSKYELVIFSGENVELEVRVSPKEDTVWLTQKQMALLFLVSVDNISLHIKNILKDNVLDNSVIEESSITSSDGKKYKTGEKRIYSPSVIFVRDGEILGIHMSTVESQENPKEGLTDEQYDELYDIYEDYINKVKGGTCSIGTFC